nr:Retrovirus-related Pol polyprotein from transposon TNT 1-94 [Ipomoea batatas]
MTNVQCYSCKNFGHFANNCTKKFCNYCKKAGHIIKECSIRPPKKHETAYNVSVGPSNVSNAGQSTITPEMVQQMIVSALSAFGLSGNNTSDSKPWYFDSGASHHMTNTALPLKNVQKYSGDLQIHTADGNSLPITAVGDISASLNNVFVSPKLSTNLISVGQLVDSNCTVQFSKSGCFVQDQVSGKMIAKGPKVGRLFPLFLSPPPVSNYVACNAVQNAPLLLLILLQVSLWLLRINLRQLILFHQVPVIPLLFVEALDLTNQLKGMVFQPLWLCLLCYLLSLSPLVIKRQWNISVGNKQWKKNFKHLKKIILGTLFRVPKMLSPLVASGFTL